MLLTCHTAMSQCLTQKEPVRYTNKLIKKTTDTNYREYLQLTIKSKSKYMYVYDILIVITHHMVTIT